jgi:para-aminobenzoate synthetase component 1
LIAGDAMRCCKFVDAVHGSVVELKDYVKTITAQSKNALASAFAEVDYFQQSGCWIALKLNYSLGAWFESKAPDPSAYILDKEEPRFSAYVFRQMSTKTEWQASLSEQCGRIVEAVPRIGYEEYKRKIDDIRLRIENGEVYQVNFSFPMDVRIDGNPEGLFRRKLTQHPVSHAAYIDDGQSIVLSFSPELFLERRGGILLSRPMKGTAPRHTDKIEDLKSGDELKRSEKNRAENAMIVDLLRNDMGKIARTGSVRVESLFDLERYPSIWTLTSTIKAEIGEASLFDVIKSMFPCGSIVGAPKIAAMHCIDALEQFDRGLYCGSVGWLSPGGDFSLNVAIRTLVLDKAGRGVYGVGGGIVFDSEAELEWAECKWKSRILGETELGN